MPVTLPRKKMRLNGIHPHGQKNRLTAATLNELLNFACARWQRINGGLQEYLATYMERRKSYADMHPGYKVPGFVQ